MKRIWPIVAVGVDVLAGIALIPTRVHGHGDRRAAFGESWTDDTIAPGGHNGCDTRNDILDRDLVEKVTRGLQIGASVQFDHIVSAAVTAQPLVVTGQRVEDMPPTRSERRP